jgi:recombination protein RecA
LDSIKSILKSISSKFGDEVVKFGVDKSSKRKFSLGSPSLDFMTYNSIPEGIFIELSGAEGSGKTLLSFLIAANYSKKEMLKPEEERRSILFVDAEGTADPEWSNVATHYDMNSKDIQTIYLTPMGQSAEQIFDMVRDLVSTGQVGLVIFDSLTAIAPQQTNEESFEKKDMGGLAKPLADFVKRCTGLFNKYNTTFIGIMGNIQNISGYGNPETTPGGTYWRRACSLRLKAKRGSYFDEEGNELKSTAENPAGHVIEVALLKSKFCRSDRRLGRCHLHYRKGIDILWDTIEMAINLGLIDDSTQGSFKLIDIETGEILKDDEGNELKIRGKKNLKPYFEEHPIMWKQLYDKIYDKISVKDDYTIKSFEELLNIDINSIIGGDIDEESN